VFTPSAAYRYVPEFYVAAIFLLIGWGFFYPFAIAPTARPQLPEFLERARCGRRLVKLVAVHGNRQPLSDTFVVVFMAFCHPAPSILHRGRFITLSL